jgi:sugar fermentation stimulation protein A
VRFDPPLQRGVLVRRYKRFLADVVLDDGTEAIAHCPNPGSMLSVDTPGAEVWLSPAAAAARKLRYTWELIRIGPALVGIHTGRTNALALEALAEDRIGPLAGYPLVRREVRYGRGSRVDILLQANDRPACYVEVKNVTLKRDGGHSGRLEFPDAVTARGLKHLRELIDVVARGHRAVMLFVAQRGDGDHLAIARDIDPAYASGLARAAAAGVEVVCYDCEVETVGVRVRSPLAVRIAPA